MATKKTQTKKAKKEVPVAGVAAGVAAAAAAAGAAYYFYGSKKAKSHRHKAAAWAGKLRSDVVREAKKLQKLDDVVMHKLVDRVAGTYRATKAVDPRELMSAANELKQSWRMVAKEIKDAGGYAKKGAKKAAKRAKKAVKRPAKKAA